MGRITHRAFSVLLIALLGACTARLPADLELVAVRPAKLETASLAESNNPASRVLEIAFASRVNLLRFVNVNGYSLDAEADYCDGPAAQQPLVVSGLYWEGKPLMPGAGDAIRRHGGRDSLLAYSFFVDGDKAAARPADLCFVVAGASETRGYRSNTVVIPAGDVAGALQELPLAAD